MRREKIINPNKKIEFLGNTIKNNEIYPNKKAILLQLN